MTEGAQTAALDARRARLVRLFGAIVAFDAEALEAERRAAPPGEPDAAWREVALMAHLFCGVPRTLAALEVLASVGGLAAPEDAEVLGPDDAGLARGAALFDRIYGAGAPDVRGALEASHPDLARWIAEHAYGRVLSRPGLDAATRELCVVAALAITGHDRQLAGHARGAVRCGATRAEVLAAVALVRRWTPAPWQRRAAEVAAQFSE